MAKLSQRAARPIEVSVNGSPRPVSLPLHREEGDDADAEPASRRPVSLAQFQDQLQSNYPPLHLATASEDDSSPEEDVAARTATDAGDADFVVGPQAAAFRARCFPEATDAEWNDWKWQLRHRIRDLAGLERCLRLSPDEHETAVRLGDRLPVGITPYYASLMDPDDPMDPIRRTMLPIADEFEHSAGESEDPLNEDGDMPVEGLVHRYPDRVLFLVTSFCATYCRYCTRSRLVGKTGEYHFNTRQFERALAYIEATPEIRDVLISGGDPLTMNDERIDWLLTRLRAIPHVEFIRIGSKIPCVLPQRITPALATILRKHHPFWMSVHFMHPAEITPEVAQSCGRLADAGIPLGSQTVLTRDVNDDPETMKRLMHALLRIRVRPYYIYQCDPIPGSRHFRTPVETGLRIIEALRGHTTGYAVPNFVIDGPGGGGKIPLSPEYVVGRDGDDLLIRNYEGHVFRYPDPLPDGAVSLAGRAGSTAR
ncbi:MAG: KamA family radical SAM protein [Phycisphaerales bacterium]|nr:KamA family radical SAM protein [Phycisphaerales bacterium]